MRIFGQREIDPLKSHCNFFFTKKPTARTAAALLNRSLKKNVATTQMSSHIEFKETATLSLSPHLYPMASLTNSSIVSNNSTCTSSASSSRSPSPCKKISSSLSSNIEPYTTPVKIAGPVSYNDECNVRRIEETLYKKDLCDSSHQIAGHCKDKGYKNFLVSKQLGRIYKPILLKKSKKEAENFTFEKEIYFYERKLPMVPELTSFIPRYYGIQYIVDEEGKSSFVFCLFDKRFLN